MTAWTYSQRGSAPFEGITSTPLDSLVASYLDYIATVKTSASARVDTWYVRRIFNLDGKGAPCLAARFLEEISTPQVHDFLLGIMRARGLAPKTGNRYREVLARVFNWAIRYRGVRMANPVAAIEHFREHAREIRFLTLAEIQAQLDALVELPHFRAMVATFIYAGLRRSEVLWLTTRDVDLGAGKHGLIHVRAKTVDGLFWEPKTRRNRPVPVNSALRPILEQYAAMVDPARTWYFPSPRGTRWDRDNFSGRLRDLNRARGLSWSCLDYRHTFGSQLAMKGESLYKISELMGNSPEICRRHYAALLTESLIGAVEFPKMGEEGL